MDVLSILQMIETALATSFSFKFCLLKGTSNGRAGCLPCQGDQGNLFPHKNVRELPVKFGPFCNVREISGKSYPFH